jgi:hypothetical protein
MMPSSVAPTRLSQPRAWPSRVVPLELRGGELLQQRPALAQRPLDQRLAARIGEQIERDHQRRRLLRQPLDPARRRMDALEQGVERERPAVRHDDLAVEHEALGAQRLGGGDDLGEIAGERLAGFRLQLDLGAVAEHQAAEAVPFRLVLPLRPGRDLVDRERLHRRKRGMQRERHTRDLPSAYPGQACPRT